MQCSVTITSVGHLVWVDLLAEDDITVNHLPGERHRVLDVHIVVTSAVDHLNTNQSSVFTTSTNHSPVFWPHHQGVVPHVSCAVDHAGRGVATPVVPVPGQTPGE